MDFILINFVIVLVCSFVSNFSYMKTDSKKLSIFFRVIAIIYLLALLALTIKSSFFTFSVLISILFISFILLFMISFYLVLAYRKAFWTKDYILTAVILIYCLLYIVSLSANFILSPM